MKHPPSICLMTAVANERPHYKSFLRSCQMQQVEPVILRGCTTWGLGQKIRLVGEFLATEQSRRFDCFILCDAFDVILQKPLAEIALPYLERSPDRIVFSAEKYCYPDPWKRAIYPSAPNEYRFLNSGFWMATAELTRKMFEMIVPENIPAWINDQQVFTDVYFAKVLPIQLDHQSEYCQSLNGALDDVEYDHDAKLVRNRITGTTPGMIHGNGNVDLVPTIRCVLGTEPE